LYYGRTLPVARFAWCDGRKSLDDAYGHGDGRHYHKHRFSIGFGRIMEKHIQQTVFHKGNPERIIQKQAKPSTHDGLSTNRLLSGKSLSKPKGKTVQAEPSVPTTMVPAGTGEEVKEKIDHFMCPTSHLPYVGMCPVTACPANISHLNKHSGCAYNFLRGKQELTQYELSYVFNVPIKQVKAHIAAGQKQIKAALFLNNIITRIRDNQKHRHFCPECGIGRDNQGACLNKLHCSSRATTATTMLARAPFNIPDIGMTNALFFTLVFRLPMLEEMLVKVNNGLTINDVFGGLTDDEMLTLRKLKTY